MRLPLSAALAIATFAGSSHAKNAIDQEQADAFDCPGCLQSRQAAELTKETFQVFSCAVMTQTSWRDIL